MDKEMYLGLKRAADESMEAALITVTNVLGSAPRKPGAKMLVFADGTTVGTIGGGCGEAEGRREALNVIAVHTSKIYYLNMTAEVASEEGMVCGGIMGLFIDYLGPQRPLEQIEITNDYLSCLANHNPILVTVIEASERTLVGRKMYIGDHGEIRGDLELKELTGIAVENAKSRRKWCRPVLVSLDSEYEPCDTSVQKAAYRLLVEPRQAVVQLLILGAGHIAVPLAAMAKMVGYEVTVVDDRLAFANAYRFPTADRILCDDFEHALDKITIDPQTFVVIITRGHRYDKLCLRKVINQPASYTGMIGSRRRVKAMLSELEEEGISSEALKKLYSPIGLKIGAETPEEIAVSILSELIKVQRELDQNG